MAIAANNRLHYDGSTVIDPHTFSYTVGAGASLLVVKIAIEIALGNDISEVRWGGAGGTLMTQRASANSGGSLGRIARIYTLTSPAVATQDVWVDLTTTRRLGMEVVWFSGVDTTSPIADAGSGTSGTATVQTSAALVPGGSGRWLETVASWGNASLAVTPSSSTETNDIDVGAEVRSAHSFQDNVSANTQPSWATDLGGTQAWSMAAILIAPAAAAEKRPSPVWRSPSMVPRHLLEA